MLGNRLENVQREIDAANADRLARIVHGANTNAQRWASRSFAARSTDLKPPEQEAIEEVPPVDTLQKQIADLRRDLTGLQLRVAQDADDREEQEEQFNGYFPTVAPPFENFLSFAFYRVSDSQISVKPGALRLHGDKIITTSETTITFSGSVEWVYVEFTRGNSTATVTHSSSEPSTGPGSQLVRIPLYYFEATAVSWKLVKDCRLDFNFDTGM